jgi:hypothetical protein
MSKELATMQSREISVIPSQAEWGTIYNMAKALLPTGFLPNSIKTAEQATAIMLKGRELNVPPMYSLSNIVIVQGKPTVSAEMMLALVQRDHGIEAMWVEESTNDYCKVGYKSGNGKKFYTFSMDDAKRANLTKNPVWSQYPAAMCRARAISAVARMAFPGSIGGMYVPGELGDPVNVTDEGEVQSVGTYNPSTDTGVPPHAAMSRGYTVEVVNEDTGEITDDEVERVRAMSDLIDAAMEHGYTEDDIEVYFDRAGIDPDTVDVARIQNVTNGINRNPVLFGETVEKHRLQMQAANDPELQPSDEQLGIK